MSQPEDIMAKYEHSGLSILELILAPSWSLQLGLAYFSLVGFGLFETH